MAGNDAVVDLISAKIDCDIDAGNIDDDDDDCEGQAPRADVLFKRRPPPRWIHGQQVSPSSSLSSLSGGI